MEFGYEQILYKQGDEPKGIYLISNGAFELQLPSLVKQKATEQTGQYFGIDAGVKH
jgi:CRP-like cAMP-binding protein